MTDLDVIKELSTILDLSIQQVRYSKIPEWTHKPVGYFSIDSNQKVNGLLLRKNIVEIPDIIGELTYLKYLNLSGNKISDIRPIAELINLERLFLYNNRIKDLNPLRKLKKLIELNIHQNRISVLKGIEGLNQLKTLDLCINLIEDLSPLSGLNNLQKLDIRVSKVTDLSPLQQHFISGLFEINCDRRDLMIPPYEVSSIGYKAIRNWFKTYAKDLFEVKVLFVGDAEAGKTSLIKRLKYNKFNPKENQTNGIVIEDYTFKNIKTPNTQLNNNIIAYFWDFGGQEIMCSTHQFFMTKRGVYVLVLEARKDVEADKQARIWLNRISSLGGNSPVIIVLNKIDLNPSFSLDSYMLMKEYPQIKSIIPISCSTTENLDKLQSSLEETIPQAELFKAEIGIKWIYIKKELQQLTSIEHFISHKEYKQICEKYLIVEINDQIQAIKFIHDLGIVLHFDELELSEYYVLNPYWVTNGVYKIITSHTAAMQKGKVNIHQLEDIMNEESINPYAENDQNLTNTRRRASSITTKPNIIEYSPNEVRYLVDIMAHFKLCYYMDNKQAILIPDLLDNKTPLAAIECISNASEKLSIILRYTYLPKSYLPRLMVVLNKDIEIAWRSGVLFKSCEDPKTKALVVAQDNSITIDVIGEHKVKRDYLSVLRHFIGKINTDFNLTPKYYIPIPGHPDIFVDYEDVLGHELEGIKYYFVGRIRKRIPVKTLLEGIVPESEIHNQSHIIKRFYYGNNECNPDPETILLSKVESIRRNQESMVLNQELISAKYESLYKDLMSREANVKQMNDIERIIGNLLEKESHKIIGEIIHFIISSLSEFNKEVDDKIKEVIQIIENTDDWDTKVILSIPLMNYLGVSLEHNFKLNSFFKNLK